MGRGAAAADPPDGPLVVEEMMGAERDSEMEHMAEGGKFDRSSLTSGHAETIGRRPTMEDSVVTVRRFRGKLDEDYWGLFDGHGGKLVSAWLAERLHGYLGNAVAALGGKRSDAVVRSAIDESFRLASAALRKEVPTSCRMGSTAVIAVLLQRTLHIANCGDSRAVLCNAGNAHRLSFDHKPELPCERQRIREAGGHVCQTHPLGPARVDGVLSVSRSFGDFLLAPKVTWHPYHAERRLTPADEFVVLGCDGVWDVLDDQTAVDIGRKALEAGKPPKVAARQIMNASLQRGSTDNISVIVLQLTKQLGGQSTSPTDDVMAAMEAAIAGNGGVGIASAASQSPGRFGDRMSGRGILTRVNPSPRRAGRAPRDTGAPKSGRRSNRGPPQPAAGGGMAMPDSPADRRRQQRTADAERFSHTMSIHQQTTTTTTTTTPVVGAPHPPAAMAVAAEDRDSDMSTTESDESDDLEDDLGGMWDGVHTPSKEVVKGAVESGAVVMARPLLSSLEGVSAAGAIMGAAQSTPPGTVSNHAYSALTTQSWGAVGGATSGQPQPTPTLTLGGDMAGLGGVMGDVLGGGGSPPGAAGGHRSARKGGGMFG